jgi:hypothetical protein
VKIVGWQSHNLYSDFGGLYANKASAGFAPPVAEWERAPLLMIKSFDSEIQLLELTTSAREMHPLLFEN